MLALLVLPRRFSPGAWYAALFASAAALLQAVGMWGLSGPVLESHDWIPAIGARLSFHLDGISYLLVLMTAVVSFLGILASPGKPASYYAMLLLLEAGSFGVFLAQDLLLFFICFEAVLIPMYFLIGIWGGEQRRRAAFKFVLYTVVGSIALLVGILTLYLEFARSTGQYTFDWMRLRELELNPAMGSFVFWTLFLGFAIKVPMFPFHTWLPDAHTEAPTAGSVMLAAVMLKMGTYGFTRFSLPLLPKTGAETEIAGLLGAVSLVAIIYGGLVCLAQQDWKRLIAYSSVSHLGFCTLGIFSANATGILGSVLQQVNHGISTALLFLLVGFMYERRHTREIAAYGGLAKGMPGFAFVFAVAMLSSIGLPLLNGFVGEFTILRGAYLAAPWWAAVGVIGVVLSAAYMLMLYQRTMLGENQREENRRVPDLTLREWLVAVPLMLWAAAIGVVPGPYFAMLAGPVEEIAGRLRP
jgi:NADH-quinone oxidoreductase subunit M